MQIKNNAEFAAFLNELSESHFEEGELLKQEVDLDTLDYRWFLTTILSAMEKDYILDIVDNNDVSSNQYKIIDAYIDDSIKNLIKLNVTKIEDNSNHQLQFLIKKVDDTRAHDMHKYCVTTLDAFYAFKFKK